MVRRVAYLTAALALASGLAGCSMSLFGSGNDGRAEWRAKAENACMRQIDSTPFAVKMKRVDGRGACGINKPLKVSAFADGSIALGDDATLGCPITMAVDGWLREAVQPAAMAWFGAPVVAIKQISDYSCRPRNNIQGEKLSEHAFGNALDVAGFVFADGSEVLVKTGWRGTPAEQGFLREVEALACQRFTTVLGPGAPYHSDHFHVDLARHGKSGTYAYCNPKPQVVPPVRAPYTPGQIATPADPAAIPVYTGGIARAGSD